MKVGSLVKNTWFGTIHLVIAIDDTRDVVKTRLITLEDGEQWMEEELEIIRESW